MDIWNTVDDKDKIQHVIERASSVVTGFVFGGWNEIFREDIIVKEINISYGILQGEKRDANVAIAKTNEQEIYIKFQIKDGIRMLDVNDRSLGFEGFFAFMFFTQFRVTRENKRSILFF